MMSIAVAVGQNVNENEGILIDIYESSYLLS